MLVFVPVFFFASEYAQISLGKTPRRAGLFLLYFFIGFVGRRADRRPDAGPGRGEAAGRSWAARCPPSGSGCGPARSPGSDFSTQQWYIILAGAGMGLMLGPASTDAVNRASRLSYGEATGITQTVRNYAASLGLAILGTILVTRCAPTHHLADRAALPSARRTPRRRPVAVRGSAAAAERGVDPRFIRLDFADATQTVLCVMAVIMAVAAVIALVGLRSGLQGGQSAEAATGETTAASPTVD